MGKTIWFQNISALLFFRDTPLSRMTLRLFRDTDFNFGTIRKKSGRLVTLLLGPAAVESTADVNIGSRGRVILAAGGG